MRQVFTQYGGLIAAAVTAVGLLGLFSGMSWREHRGMNGIAGGLLETQVSEAYVGERATTEYSRLKRVEVREVRFCYDNPVITGERTRLEDHFAVETSDGSSTGFHVRLLTGPGEREIAVRQEDGGSYAVFPGEGVYRICLTAGTGQVRRKEVYMDFPVD